MIVADAFTAGTIGGTIAAVLAAAACAALGRFFWRDYYSGRGEAIAAFVAAGVVVPLVWLGAMWPLAGDYHRWRPVEGTVVQVDKRLVSNGDNGMSERFVFRFADGRLRGVDDTRASTVRRGDKVTLKCKKDFEWGVPRAANGWACRWAGAGQ